MYLFIFFFFSLSSEFNVINNVFSSGKQCHCAISCCIVRAVLLQFSAHHLQTQYAITVYKSALLHYVQLFKVNVAHDYAQVSDKTHPKQLKGSVDIDVDCNNYKSFPTFVIKYEIAIIITWDKGVEIHYCYTTNFINYN